MKMAKPVAIALLVLCLGGCSTAPADPEADGLAQAALITCPATPVECEVRADCPAGMYCTREWNPSILYQFDANPSLAQHFGHCIEPFPSANQCSATDAIQADFDAIGELAGGIVGTGAPGLGIPYSFPANSRLLITDPDSDGTALSTDARMIIDGAGAYLSVPMNVIALAVNAELSTVRDLTIAVDVNTDHTGVGVEVNSSHVRLSNIWVMREGTGVRAVDDVVGEVLNAQRWENLRIQQSRRYGVQIDGQDTNAGLFQGFSVTSSVREGSEQSVGVLESSYFGNAHVGHHLEGNEIALNVKTGGAQQSTLVGTYVEGSDEVVMGPGAHSTTTVGGLLGDRVTQGDVLGSGRSRVRFAATDANGYTYIATLPDAPGQSAMTWQLQHPNASLQERPWFLRPSFTAGVDGWRFQSARSASQIPLEFWVNDDASDSGIDVDNQLFCDYAATCSP